MSAERDLFQEIEEEIRNSNESAKRSLRRIAVSLLIVLLLCVIGGGSWMLLSDTTPVTAVSALVFGTPTPTPTNTPTHTPTPTNTPIPTETPLATATPIVPPTIAPPTEPPSPTPIPTRAWGESVGQPLASEMAMTSLPLQDLNAQVLIALSIEMGYKEDALLAELDFVRALSPGFVDDTLINPLLPLRGALPNEPLFLFVGEMVDSAEFQNNTGIMSVRLPWSATTIKAQLPSALVNQVDNASLIVNSWPMKGGWVWFLASSPTLERAIVACRNSAPAVTTFPMPGGDSGCQKQAALLSSGELEVFVELLMGVGADGTTLEPLLPQPASTLTDRWVYADFGPHGTQLALASPYNSIASSAEVNFGLMRFSWSDNQFQPDLMLKPTYTNGVQLYEFLWSQPD